MQHRKTANQRHSDMMRSYPHIACRRTLRRDCPACGGGHDSRVRACFHGRTESWASDGRIDPCGLRQHPHRSGNFRCRFFTPWSRRRSHNVIRRRHINGVATGPPRPVVEQIDRLGHASRGPRDPVLLDHGIDQYQLIQRRIDFSSDGCARAIRTQPYQRAYPCRNRSRTGAGQTNRPQMRPR